MRNLTKLEWWCRLAIGGSALLLHLGNIRLACAESTETIGVIDESGKGHVTEESRQHHCCARHERMMDVGEGISREIIRIDAGHCRRLCPRHVTDDPGDASRPAVQRCPPNSHCHPRAARLERVSTLQGVKVIEAVDTCDCSMDLACRRESFTHLVHSGTPYQVVVDVGVCMGSCTKDLGCKPLKNRTISVNGPNGDEIYQAIEKCGCAGNCHRMDHMESVLDFSEIEIKEGTNTTDVNPIVRQINVGQCVGSCPGNEMETCLLRDKKEPRRCLAGLYSKQHTCTPASFKVHEYRILCTREVFRIRYQFTETYAKSTPFARTILRLQVRGNFYREHTTMPSFKCTSEV